MKLTIKMSTGTTYDFDGKWGTVSDGVAFERRFNVNASIMAQMMGENGKKSPDFREEWMAFLAWRCLRRHDPSVAEFDEFIDDMEQLIFGGEEAENPTETPGQEEGHSAQVVQLG